MARQPLAAVDSMLGSRLRVYFVTARVFWPGERRLPLPYPSQPARIDSAKSPNVALTVAGQPATASPAGPPARGLLVLISLIVALAALAMLLSYRAQFA
jgi:hypothetical protein